MDNIENWNEVTKGLYRYVIAANVAYEIQLIYWNQEDSIYDAKARLYISGDWYETTEGKQKNFFERELLLNFGKVSDCIRCAIEDYKTMS